MELLKHELYKIFSKKGIYFAAAFFLMLYGLFVYTNPGMKRSDEHKYMKDWVGPVTDEKIRLAKEGIASIKTEKVVTDKGEVYYVPDRSPEVQGMLRVYEEVLDVADAVKERDSYIRNLENNIMQMSEEDSFEYRKQVLEYDMLRNIAPPGLYYNKGWAQAVDFINTMGLVIMGALILLGLSPVFSEEYSTGVYAIILSSKNGKRKVITAKILASFIYIFAMALLFFLVNIGTSIYIHGSIGAENPIQSLYKYKNSPYNLSLWQYVLSQVGTHVFGSMAFGLLILIMSILSRSSLLAFFTGGLVFGVPILMESILNIRSGWINELIGFSYAEFMKVESFYMNFRAYDILGTPVLHLNLAILIMSVLSIIFVYLIYRNFRRP